MKDDVNTVPDQPANQAEDANATGPSPVRSRRARWPGWKYIRGLVPPILVLAGVKAWGAGEFYFGKVISAGSWWPGGLDSVDTSLPW